MLPIAMTTGASIYLIYNAVPCLHRYGSFLSGIVSGLQPLCIFTMLFLTFCRIEPKDLKPHRWHWWLLLIQGGLFTILGLLAYWLLAAFPVSSNDWVVLMEGAMLCLICPTATAAAVVTRKLGGDVPGITTYIILINLLTAVLVPLIEEGIVDNEIMDLTLKHYLDDFIRENHLKKLVLGCTHYPFLKKNFGRIYPEIDLLNPSKEVIYEVQRILQERDMLADETNTAEHLCYASDLSENFHNVVNRVFEDDQEVRLEFKKVGE